jgi:hypothetical protein
MQINITYKMEIDKFKDKLYHIDKLIELETEKLKYLKLHKEGLIQFLLEKNNKQTL